MMSKEEGNEELTINTDNVNLEHIIPKNPNADWNRFLKSKKIKLENFLYMIGNQTILYKEYNREVSNLFFDEKLKIYKKSVLPINRKLINLSEFGDDQILERQIEFGQSANKIWQV